MSETSPILSLPFLMPAQAQKHVTHNEALVALDILVQLAVEGVDATTPPANPVEGEVHILGAGATGDWAGRDGTVAAFTQGGWLFLAPRDGWIAVETATGALRVRRDGGWTGPRVENAGGLGIGTQSDATNRLSVAADATLLSHAGAGHRLTVNKATPGETASLLFQSDWSGRAEMGLAGEDGWSIKVSADGTDWTTALRLDPATGAASGAAVQSAPADVTPGRLMRADYGYGPGNLVGTVSQSDGTPTGAVIETGATGAHHYTRLADGTQICTGPFSDTGVSLTTAQAGGFGGQAGAIPFAAAFAEAPVVSIMLDDATDALFAGTSVTPTTATPGLWSAVSGAVDVAGRYLAVGRWL